MKKVFVNVGNYHSSCDLCGSFTCVDIDVHIDEFHEKIEFDNHHGECSPIDSMESFFSWLLNILNVSIQTKVKCALSCIDVIKDFEIEKSLNILCDEKVVHVSDTSGYQKEYLFYDYITIVTDYLKSFVNFSLVETNEYEEDEDC
jgi:hypothetical protein